MPMLKDSPICSDSAKHQTTERREAWKATLIFFIHIVQGSWNILHLHSACTHAIDVQILNVSTYSSIVCSALQIACMFLSIFVVSLFAQSHHQIPIALICAGLAGYAAPW